MINTINNKVFRNANEAYEYVHDKILQEGVEFGGTKALFNVGFYITDPKDRKITNRERNWKEDTNKWLIEININNKIHKDPDRYNNEVVYNKVNEYYKYYYDKYNKQ